MHADSLGAYHNFQAGVLRNAEETLAELREQLRLSTFGVAKVVTSRQSATGIKDKIVQVFIEETIAQARLLKQQQPNRSKDDISDELWKALAARLDAILNPLLMLRGT